MSGAIVKELPETKAPFDWKRVVFIIGGLALFAFIYYSPAWPDAIDPKGAHFVLTKQARARSPSLPWPPPGGFSRWCRSASPASDRLAAGPVPHPQAGRGLQRLHGPLGPVHLWFGGDRHGFHQNRPYRRIAYKMLSIIGEKTSMIMLGCFVMTVALTHVMAHTAWPPPCFPC